MAFGKKHGMKRGMLSPAGDISDRTILVLLLLVIVMSLLSLSVYIYSFNLAIVRHVKFPTPINQDYIINNGDVVSIHILSQNRSLDKITTG